MMEKTRREVLVEILGFAGVATAVACGGDEEDDGGICPGGPMVEITTTHQHSLTIPEADVEAGVTKTYTITGAHTHEITLTESDFERLADGKSVGMPSTVDSGHDHQILIIC